MAPCVCVLSSTSFLRPHFRLYALSHPCNCRIIGHAGFSTAVRNNLQWTLMGHHEVVSSLEACLYGESWTNVSQCAMYTLHLSSQNAQAWWGPLWGLGKKRASASIPVVLETAMWITECCHKFSMRELTDPHEHVCLKEQWWSVPGATSYEHRKKNDTISQELLIETAVTKVNTFALVFLEIER